ncbi:MAG TPA: ATP-binding protein [Candidatus Eisenbacteria bacterium]|nr:ATP-binding protein [Candidatus Eisenbacteria bacterium]
MLAEPATLGVEPATQVLDVGTLTQAFETFTAATRRLEREYAALRRRVTLLTAELEEKNRRLAASLERERALEATALRQSRLAAMGEMAAMLAHEVRNPLGAMELFTGLLLQDLQEQPEPQRLARQVAAGIADLNHLVTNLLEFTRTRRTVERGDARVECRAAVEDALRYASDLIEAGGITVVRDLPAAEVTARGDAALLRPALLNLVRNAVQAMPAGGTLTATVARDGGGVAVTIADSGPGIPAEVRASIFTPFFTTRAKGTGLGLTVVRELVTALGGEVTLADGAGGGAAFTIVLQAA